MGWMALFSELAGALQDEQKEKSIQRRNIFESDRARQDQLDAAQKGIQWRVADAKAAGIHPLYALGSPGISLSPTPLFQQSGGGSGFGGLSQDISRELMSMKTNDERRREVAAASVRGAAGEALQLEHMSLQNEMLRSQIARFNSAQLGPPAPSMGGFAGSSDRVQPVPATPVINSPIQHGREAGNITDYAFSRSHMGGLVPVPSNDVKNRIEDSPMEWLWWWRNNVMPNFGGMPRPSLREFPLPDGQTWEWNVREQQFLPRDRRGVWHVRGR